MASCKEYEERAIDTAPHQQPGCALSWSTYDGTQAEEAHPHDSARLGDSHTHLGPDLSSP